MKIGYARVLTDEQNPALQLHEALAKEGHGHPARRARVQPLTGWGEAPACLALLRVRDCHRMVETASARGA